MKTWHVIALLALLDIALLIIVCDTQLSLKDCRRQKEQVENAYEWLACSHGGCK
jgi:hypothetical protein